ncbi:hypothetical protein BDM02DRAFT_1265335 [Thelephora ganbajun]|uniref:Uncharacterized protein n=1 Tax=Thelephora ganbajun TaxID=370292 RepID=A0ACB6ZMG6_THEGA|nr:hypothetical protein BDM02DRAFT_1265335 [Thelephora ganbajun]
MSNLGVITRPDFVRLTMVILPESVVDCTSGLGDLRHLSARITRLCEISTTNSHPQWDPHRNGSINVSPR